MVGVAVVVAGHDTSGSAVGVAVVTDIVQGMHGL